MGVAVVGSGTSGIFAAHALAARGLQVTILDVGEELEGQRQAAVSRMHDLDPEDWPPADYGLISENATFGKRVLPKKVHFGSDYIYAEDRPFSRIATGVEGRVSYPTFAKGGFSNIWGAAVLPPDTCDTIDWPVSRAEMEPYFRMTAQLIPLCGGDGTLDRSFPAYKDALGDFDAGPQGDALLADLKRAETRLLERRTIYGKARLAIHTQVANGGVLPCIGCGHCFTGCVRGSIFSTLPLLDDLIRNHRVIYLPNMFVDHIEEIGESVTVRAFETRTGEWLSLKFEAVFVAAGPINTTRLLLKARDLYDHPVVLKESQKFVVPMMRLHGAESAIEHPSVTLASVFLETKVTELSDHWIHTQIVPMNPMMARSAGLPAIDHQHVRYLLKPLLRRLMAAWVGMHSDHSSHLELRLQRDRERQIDVLNLDLKVHTEAQAAARLAAKDLFAQGLMFRTVFCYWMIKFSNPGSGTHCGASFPMKNHPSNVLHSDRLGRPFGWSRIFVVDSSVLPSIPGTTLAFSVMANAYRIATQAPV
jgi:choline dehydrogenase-like flavoprotein